MLIKSTAKQLLQESVIYNRSFNEKMRAKYFKKFRYIFKKLYREFDIDKAVNNISYIYEYLIRVTFQLKQCKYFSAEALFGYESGLVPNYSKENKYGVLEEEKIFKILVEEFLSLISFLENFIATEYSLINYKTAMIKFKTKTNIKSGFISNLTAKIDNKAHVILLETQLDFLMARLKTLNEIHKIILNNHKYIN